VLTDAQGANNSEIAPIGSRGDHDFVLHAQWKNEFSAIHLTSGMPAAGAAPAGHRQPREARPQPRVSPRARASESGVEVISADVKS